jgi:hypothetical protein
VIALPSPDTFDYKLVAWSLYRVETRFRGRRSR